MISVIIPVYKVEKYLDCCIESVIQQTYTNLEIILVDDGSPDSCPQKCDEWKQRDSRIKVLHKQNGGLSSARNEGLNIMSGEYVFFIDSDDFIQQNALELLYNEMQKKEADIVVSALFSFDNRDTVYKTNNVTFLSGTNELFFLQKISNHACGKLYKSELFDNIRYPLNRNYEDIATTYMLFSKAKCVAYTDAGLYFYRIHNESITGTLTVKNLSDLRYAYESVKGNITHEPIYNFYLLTIIYTLYSRWVRASYDIKQILKWRGYIREEFNEISYSIKWCDYITKSPMCIKLILYKLHIAGVCMVLKDIKEKVLKNR